MLQDHMYGVRDERTDHDCTALSARDILDVRSWKAREGYPCWGRVRLYSTTSRVVAPNNNTEHGVLKLHTRKCIRGKGE